ncbi:MAG: NAD(P)H-dependent oxidoreductase [Planctomycetota bacterium]
MKTLLVLAHPEPKSFNGALFCEAESVLRRAGHDVRTSDLYAMKFNPVSGRTNFTVAKDPDYFQQQAEEANAVATGGFASDVEAEWKKLAWCDLMVWQFPLWWFGPPAILKGWADKVLAMGRAWGMGHMYDTGLLKGKRALVSVTTGGPAEAYVPGGFSGDIHSILRVVHRGIFRFTGMDVLAPHIIYSPAHLTDAERKRHLREFAKRLMTIDREKPIEVGNF